MDAVSEYIYLSRWLAFIEAIVASLAWPLATVAGALILRPFVSRTLNSLKSIRYGNTEAIFDREVDEFVQDVRGLGIEPDVQSVQSTPDNLQLLILKTWAGIEETIKRWINKKISEQGLTEGSDSSRMKETRLLNRNARLDLNLLFRNQVISADLKSTLDELRDLRNKAAHSSNFELQAGRALDLAASLNSIQKELKESLDKFDLSGEQLKIDLTSR